MLQSSSSQVILNGVQLGNVKFLLLNANADQTLITCTYLVEELGFMVSKEAYVENLEVKDNGVIFHLITT